MDIAQGTLIFDGQILNINMEDSHGAPQIAEKITQLSGACEVPHAGRDAKLEGAKMLISRLLREAVSDPVVCPRSRDC